MTRPDYFAELLQYYHWRSGYKQIASYVYSAKAYQNTPQDHPDNLWRAVCCWQAAAARGLVDC